MREHFEKLEKSQESVEEKMDRLKSTLKRINIEVKESWKSMVTEDLVLSKIEFLEEKMLKLKPAKSSIERINQDIKFLEEKVLELKPVKSSIERINQDIKFIDKKLDVLWGSQKSTFYILITFSIMISAILVLFMFTFEIGISRINRLQTW